MINRLGNPPETVLSRIASPQTAKVSMVSPLHVRNLRLIACDSRPLSQNLRAIQRQRIPPLGEFIPNTTQAELKIIEKTLLWDPLRRVRVAALLHEGYFTPWRNREDEAECGEVRSVHSHISGLDRKRRY
jgi:hypothetical protein